MSNSPGESSRKSKVQRSPNFWHSLLILIFRLLLLTVGGGLAWLLGVAVAHVYPSPSNEPPLMETLLRRSFHLLPSSPGQEQ